MLFTEENGWKQRENDNHRQKTGEDTAVLADDPEPRKGMESVGSRFSALLHGGADLQASASPKTGKGRGAIDPNNMTGAETTWVWTRSSWQGFNGLFDDKNSPAWTTLSQVLS
jgi:hypothetical protein